MGHQRNITETSMGHHGKSTEHRLDINET